MRTRAAAERAPRPKRQRPIRRARIGLLPAHERLLTDTASRYLGFVGGWGAGKTHGGALKAIQLAIANAPHPVLLVAPTFRHLEDALLVEIKKILRAWGVWDRARYHRHDHKLFFRIGGQDCELWLRHARDPDSLAGPSVAAALIDEAGLINDEIFNQVDARIRIREAPVRQLVATGTGDRGRSGWFFDIFEGSPLEGATLIRAPTWENVCLPDDYVTQRLGHLDQILYERYAAGQFVDLEGRVYSQYRAEKHNRICDNPQQGQLAFFVDFGAYVMVWGLARILKGQVHVIDELVRENVDTLEMTRLAKDWLAEKLKQWDGSAWNVDDAAAEAVIYCDPAGGDRMSSKTSLSDVAICRQAGFQVFHRQRHPAIRDRVNAVQAKLASGGLLIDVSRAPYVGRCVADQKYGTDGMPEKGRPRERTRGLDHGSDALGYLIEYEWPCEVSERRVVRYH